MPLLLFISNKGLSNRHFKILKIEPTKKEPVSIIRKCMEGEMVINSRRLPNPELNDEEKRKLLKMDKYKPEGFLSKWTGAVSTGGIDPLFKSFYKVRKFKIPKNNNF